MNTERQNRINQRTDNYRKIKGRDSENRRLETYTPTCFNDLRFCRHFDLPNGTGKYTVSTKEFEGSDQYALHNEDGECIGYLRPDGKKMEVRLRKYGILWSAKFLIKEIICHGKV